MGELNAWQGWVLVKIKYYIYFWVISFRALSAVLMTKDVMRHHKVSPFGKLWQWDTLRRRHGWDAPSSSCTTQHSRHKARKSRDGWRLQDKWWVTINLHWCTKGPLASMVDLLSLPFSISWATCKSLHPVRLVLMHKACINLIRFRHKMLLMFG